MDYLLIAVGAALLYLGGEALVRGSVSLARALGLTPLVIGLTVVAFGTSSPELASTLTATFLGAPDVAFGNVVGSNIANISLVLGFMAVIWPIGTTATFVRREVPFMLLASGLLFPLVVDSRVSRPEGLFLLALLVAFLVHLLRRKADPEPPVPGFTVPGRPRLRSLGKSLLYVVVGLSLLTAGGQALIGGAVAVARELGVSERVIGLTIVAIGTSLPELASSLVAAARRHGDLLLGNLIGSNVFNVLFILGSTALVRPLRLEAGSMWLDLIVMLAMSGLIWPFLATGLRLARWEGAILLLAYGGYVWFLFA